MHGCAVASKLKPQQPLPCASVVRCCEPPLTGGFAGQAVEISAGTGVIQTVVHYTASLINGDADADLYVAVDRDACADRYGGNFFVDRGRATNRRRLTVRRRCDL